MSQFQVELRISNGGILGDFVIDSNGQPLFDEDTFDDDAALRGELMRMIYQVPRLQVNGVYIGDADDPYHPDDGLGLQALVDQNYTAGLRSEIETRLREGMARIASILDNPPPTIVQSINELGELDIDISYTRITGDTRTLPTISLQISGG